ncbi:hypothetical protein [Bacillus solitudinis]|uniref:hypothetical protein n=1 Tax=Bacillus solitudinis TaxID=2014074 RepID=UPI000C23A9D5|nr:hypothetical protein [Bacillus solitudinis]
MEPTYILMIYLSPLLIGLFAFSIFKGNELLACLYASVITSGMYGILIIANPMIIRFFFQN